MTNTEATILVNQGIYETKAEIRSHIGTSAVAGLVGGLAGAGVGGFISLPLLVGGDSAMIPIATLGIFGDIIGTIIYYAENSMELMESKAQLKLLKALKKELVQGTDLFEDVEVKDFQKRLGEYRQSYNQQ